MSVKTWTDEFCPKSAREFRPDDEMWSEVLNGDRPPPYDKPFIRRLIDHTRLKYSGLLPENLARHSVKMTSCYVESVDEPLDGDDVFEFNCQTCSFCVAYAVECTICPVGGCHESDSAYLQSIKTQNPSHVLELMDRLEKAS